MWARFALLIPFWFMLTSTSPLAPDVNEAGRVLATLNDWRALLFAMLFIIFLLLGALLWAFGKLAKTVEVMVSLRESIVSLNDTARSAGIDARDNHNALTGMVATLARIEADMARKE